jgi:hypothetical protein
MKKTTKHNHNLTRREILIGVRFNLKENSNKDNFIYFST